MLGRVITLTIFLALQGCAQPPQLDTPISATPKVSVPAKKFVAPKVVILASEDLPAYSGVARALTTLLGKRSSIIYLSASQLENLKSINSLKDAANTQFVSIGLNASVAAKKLINKQVVFCQVYNYQDYALLSARHKGVSMLPSFAKTFAFWHRLSPDIKNVGVISGPGFEEVMQSARLAAKAHGMTLFHETVNTDKEYQYAYKNMYKKVQGYWLLPDNRVLSEHILRDIMTFSVRNSKQIVVSNDELLKLGGLLSISSDYQDIARQVAERLEQAQAKDSIPGADIVYLDKLNLRINSVMAQRLGLTIPEQYRKYANAP